MRIERSHLGIFLLLALMAIIIGKAMLELSLILLLLINVKIVKIDYTSLGFSSVKCRNYY